MSGLAAVILAGGASRRMGRDKATMPHPLRPAESMLEHTVSVLARRCSPVFVVAAPGQPLPIVAAEVLDDDVPGEGPLLATARGLRAAAEAGADRAVVSAVDMPHLCVALVDLLAARDDADVVLPWDGRDHYLAAVYRTRLADSIDALVAGGARSMRSLVDSVQTRRCELDPTGPLGRALLNVNEPPDVRGELPGD